MMFGRPSSVKLSLPPVSSAPGPAIMPVGRVWGLARPRSPAYDRVIDAYRRCVSTTAWRAGGAVVTFTSKDVARLAGVSQSTVSYVMTGKRPISESTRQRVLAAIEELTYEPNQGA